MTSSARTCYNRDGTQITDIAYQPCDNSSTSRDSFCCGTNHQGAGQTNVADDVCEANGLCQNYEPFDGTNEGVKMWWRQGCTDPTWESEECLGSVCKGALWQDENAPVRKCGDNSWCCGDENCCSVSSSLFVLAATVGQKVPSTATSSTSASGSSPVSPSATSTNPPSSITTSTPTTNLVPPTTLHSSRPSQGLSTGARAGIGLGAAVIAILLSLTLFLALKLKKKKRQERQDAIVERPHIESERKLPDTAYHDAVPPAELNGESTPVELGTGSGGMDIQELADGRKTPAGIS